MFYLWEYDTKNSDSKFFSCHMEENNELIDIPWISGEKIDKPLNIIKYYADNMLPPEDFPFNGSIEILVSNKIVEILKKLKVTGIDYYESEIIQPNGNVIKGFYTLNILNIIDCLELEKSNYIIKEIGPGIVYRFTKISLNNCKIPSGVKVFRIPEKLMLLFVDQDIKEEFDRQKISGIKLIPINEGEPYLVNEI